MENSLREQQMSTRGALASCLRVLCELQYWKINKQQHSDRESEPMALEANRPLSTTFIFRPLLLLLVARASVRFIDCLWCFMQQTFITKCARCAFFHLVIESLYYAPVK
jgi:hypothetical protein